MLWCLGSTLLCAGAVAAPDAFWHLQTGRLILDTGAVPHHDPFSWSRRQAPWITNSWAFDVALALADRLAGTGGIAALRAGLVAIALAVVTWWVRQAHRNALVVSLVVAATSVPMLALGIDARPQLADLVLLPLVFAGTHAALGIDRAPWPASGILGTGAVLAVWSNLHGTVVVGVTVVVLAAAGCAAHQRRLRAPVALTVVAAGCPLLTPYGVGVYTNALDVGGATDQVQEWRHLSPLTHPFDMVFAVAVVAALVALGVTGRWRRMPVSLPLVALAVLAVWAARFGPLLAIAAAPEVARAVGRGIRRTPTMRAVARCGAASVLVVWVGWAGGAARFGEIGATVPLRQIRAIPAGCRLLNEYAYGGPVIGLRYPQVPVSIDGRVELYEQRFVSRHTAVLAARPSPRAALRWLNEHDVGCVLLRNDRALAKTLARQGGWRRAAGGQRAVLYVRSHPEYGVRR